MEIWGLQGRSSEIIVHKLSHFDKKGGGAARDQIQWIGLKFFSGILDIYLEMPCNPGTQYYGWKVIGPTLLWALTDDYTVAPHSKEFKGTGGIYALLPFWYYCKKKYFIKYTEDKNEINLFI